MTLDEAVEKFESHFYHIKFKPKDRSELDQTCSGGTAKFDDVLPALYSSPDRAILAWLDAATSLITPNDVILEWTMKPELLDFQITIADRRQMHRLVADRYAVKSQFRTD